MAIPNESSSTHRLVNYAHYHRAALEADPAATHLAPTIVEQVEQLQQKASAKSAAEVALIRARAINDRADFELDGVCRQCELSALGSVKKDRSAPSYAAAFPNGLSALVAARGEAQARQVAILAAALETYLPDVAAEYAQSLSTSADRALSTDRAVANAEDEVGRAFTAEVIARGALVRQLHANRGGLRALYPRDSRRVRSYFPNSRRATPPELEDDVASDEETAIAAE